MALRIEKAFGPKMDTLLRMQTAFEIFEARKREGDINTKRYIPKERKPHAGPKAAREARPEYD
jgi:plasmid maintenance system antidote protein VapI